MTNGISAGLLIAVAFAAIYASGAAAQVNPQEQPGTSFAAKANGANGTPQSMPDMRLWSFGDCDNKYPYLTSAEHKECVRVVGSEEARDARAYRICETSNARDPEEVARCKSTYKANKDRSAQSGYVPNANGQKHAAPTVEELQRVRAIASAAVENDKAVAREAAQAAAEATAAVSPGAPKREIVPEEPDGPPILAIVLSLVAAGGGTFAFLQRRNRANAFSAN